MGGVGGGVVVHGGACVLVCGGGVDAAKRQKAEFERVMSRHASIFLGGVGGVGSDWGAHGLACVGGSSEGRGGERTDASQNGLNRLLIPSASRQRWRWFICQLPFESLISYLLLPIKRPSGFNPTGDPDGDPLSWLWNASTYVPLLWELRPGSVTENSVATKASTCDPLPFPLATA